MNADNAVRAADQNDSASESEHEEGNSETTLQTYARRKKNHEPSFQAFEP